MPEFHCPVGAAYYDDEDCIDCGLCYAETKEAMVTASKKLREYMKAHAEKKAIFQKVSINGKGGVGKSTVVTLLANVLREKGYSTLVIDTDESNPGLYRTFGFDKQPKPLMALLSRFSLGEPEPNTEWLTQDEILTEDIPSEYILEDDNLKFIMVGKIEDPFQGCACTMADVTRDLMGKLLIKSNEVVLVDMEAGVESFGRGVERNVDTVLVVVEPSFESITLAERITYMAEGIGVSRTRAILNKVPSEGIQERIIGKLKEQSIKVVGTLYYDLQVSEAGFEGKALGDSKAKEEMEKIARRLLEESR